MRKKNFKGRVQKRILSKSKEVVRTYNKSLKQERKMELPTIYEPLVLNCDLLFALADKLDISSTEKGKVDGILEGVFLVGTYADRYSFGSSWKVPTVKFEKNRDYTSSNSLRKKCYN